jgi:hypothetical protein
MRPTVVMDVAPGGLFGSAAYLAAAARHEGAHAGSAVVGGVRLPVLRSPSGLVYTPYGYPQPVGDVSSGALQDAAAAFATAPFPWRIALAPVGPGAVFAEALATLRQPARERPICIHDLEPLVDPIESFAASARTMARRALKLGLEIEVTEPTALFGALYRTDMEAVGADPMYSFEDDYIEQMGEVGAWQLLARDEAGVAAGALFLSDGEEATYHLSFRRRTPTPGPGAVNVLVARGLELCRDAGAKACYLGGGRTTADDDSLLQFKQPMSTRVVARPTFESPGTS